MPIIVRSSQFAVRSSQFAVRSSLSCGLIILNYIDYETTAALIDTVKEFPDFDHIVIVDNNSPNDSYSILKKYQSGKISVLSSGKNGGYSYGNNFGARYLIENYSPDIICIANPDVIFDNDLVKRVKQLFLLNNDYAILSGFQLDSEGKAAPHPFWESNSSVASILVPYCMKLTPFNYFYERKRTRNYRNYIENIRHSSKELNQVWAIEGSLFFIRTKDFEALGMLDENVFMYCEENIIACKLYKLNRKIGVINSVTYIHAHIHAQQPNSNEKMKPRNIFRKLVNAYYSYRTNIFNDSQFYYFTHYISDNKALRIIYIVLGTLCWFKDLFKRNLKKLCLKVVHILKH